MSLAASASASKATLASVSVDLDGLRHYLSIHGLHGGGDDAADPVYTVALPRFVALFAELGVKATFFAIGDALQAPAAAAALEAARLAGHEIGNHTYAHRYDLVRLSDAEVERELTLGHEAIAAACGEAPVGFRAPGYNIDDRVLAVCRKLAYRYDSSVFPSYPYYGAKAAVMAALRVLGRPSGATLGAPQVLRAPTSPYLPDPACWWRRSPPGASSPLVELPVTVVPGLRWPFIGTWVCLWPSAVFAAAWAAVRARTPFVNLELHGIELMDLVADGLPAELSRQPDLRVSLPTKRARLRSAIAAIAREAEFVPLHEAARRVAERV